MANKTPQSLANYTRYDPIFHFFVLPVSLITFIATIVMAVRHPNLHSVWVVLVALALVILTLKVRMNPIKVQDRVIRLEERQRLAMLLPEPLKSRIGDLSESQLIALRFASDGEIPALVQETLTKQLAGPEIKKSIKEWRADELRV
jgi:hypothetical protein